MVLASAAGSGTRAAATTGLASAAPACGSFALGTLPSVGGSGGGSNFSGISLASPSDQWAVGDEFDASLGVHRTLTEHFDGHSWTVVPSPNGPEPAGASPMNNGLNDVSMGAGNGWAVGYALVPAGSSPAYQALAMHWDGGSWTLAPPPTPNASADAILTGVDTVGAGEAWTVGYQTNSAGVRRTLIEHATSLAWARAASPNDGTPNNKDNTLMSVSGSTATGLWAVGYRQSPTGLRPLVLRYDTSSPAPSWISVSGAGAVPAPGKVETVLTDVDVRTSSDVWAVGYYDHGSGQRPLVLHWDGVAWTISWVPGIGLLRDVRAVSAGNVWAVGTYYSSAEGRTKTLIVHFDGASWTAVASADAPAPKADELIGVASSGDGSTVTAVGSAGTGPLVETAACGAGAVSIPTRTSPAAAPAPVAPATGPAPSPPAPTPTPVTPRQVTITDQAAAAGIGEGGATGPTWSAAVGDFNNDGWPDLFVGHHGSPGHLWINRKDGTFSEIDGGFFAGLDRHDCETGDFNRDGRLDMFCSVGADRGTGLKQNALYIQAADGSFSDQAFQWGVTDPAGRGRYSVVFDANNDGWPDIFSGSAAVRPDGLPAPNRLFLNTGHGSMLDTPSMGLDLNIGSGCAHQVDYNSDGWPDLLVCGRSDTTALGLHLYENDHGTDFRDVSAVLGATVLAEDAAMVDVNHDSRPDLVTLTLTQLAVRLQAADGSFSPPHVITSLRAGRAIAVGDVNADHNPDVYVVAGKGGSDTNQPDLLRLGTQTGTFPTQLSVPESSVSVGQGDHAYPIDYNHDGLTDFLVLNGRDTNPGRIQLLSPAATP